MPSFEEGIQSRDYELHAFALIALRELSDFVLGLTDCSFGGSYGSRFRDGESEELPFMDGSAPHVLDQNQTKIRESEVDAAFVDM